MGGWKVGNAPADYPLTYPGATPPSDAVLHGLALHPLMPPDRGAGVGAWTVRAGGTTVPVDEILAGYGAAPLDGRIAVLAVGSNACAAQIARKLRDLPPPHRIVPMTRVRAAGVATGHSAHVGRWGYVPRTPVARPGYHPHWVIWLDAEQVGIIDATEVNYDVVKGAAPLVMAADLTVKIPEWVMYRSKWGALAWPGGTSPLPAMSQDEMFGNLLRQPWFSSLLPAGAETPARAVALLARFDALRDQVREAMAANAAVHDGLRGAAPGR